MRGITEAGSVERLVELLADQGASWELLDEVADAGGVSVDAILGRWEPSLIGGVEAELGGWVLDGSVDLRGDLTVRVSRRRNHRPGVPSGQ